MSGIAIELEQSDDLRLLAQELRDFAPKRLPRLIAQASAETERYIDRLGVLDQRLGKGATPPARTINSPKFIWSFDRAKNARARRWFFANYPNGYKRTGRLEQSWRFTVTPSQDNRVVVDLRNDTNASSYVYGSPAFNYEQVPGHVTTGWPNARIGESIVLDATIYLETKLTAIIDSEIEKL